MSDPRTRIRADLHALIADPAKMRCLADDVDWAVSAPFAPMSGPSAVGDGFFAPLHEAFGGLRRRDEIFIGGENPRAEGGYWIATLCHYTGIHRAAFHGISASGRLAFLRSGEFYRVENDQITKARIILDLPDLARQGGRPLFPDRMGTEMLFPGPATHDGILPAQAGGADSLALVARMLDDLHSFNPETGTSEGQIGEGGAWAHDFQWYGPGGIGSTQGWDGFVTHHRAAFLAAFPDRKGGNHYCRIGDGAYAAVSGWPSMTMTHRGTYLGVPATGKALTLRVMDFYRTEAGRIAENWVCLDYIDLFQQMGVDLIARAQGSA